MPFFSRVIELANIKKGGTSKGRKNMAEKEVFSIWPNMQIVESQWAECSNGRSLPNPDQVDLHSRPLVSVHLLWIR